MMEFFSENSEGLIVRRIDGRMANKRERYADWSWLNPGVRGEHLTIQL